MVAKIKTNALAVYDSVVFAIADQGFDSKIVAFDRQLESLTVVPLFPPVEESLRNLNRQNYMIIDASIDGFTRVGNILGYDWLIGDDELMGKIEAREPLPTEILEKCHALQPTLHLPEWTEIQDEVSATNLLWAAGNFHDGNVRKIVREGDSATVILRAWAGDILIRVENPVFAPECDECIGAISSFGQIWSARIYFWGNRIYFVDATGCESPDELGDDWLYFSGTRMFWKIELE